MQIASLSSSQENFGRCSVCARSKYAADRNQTFPNADRLWAHIATTHVYWHPFECVLCPMVFLPTDGFLKQHYERTHPEKVPKAIYTYVEKKKAAIGRIFEESQEILESNMVYNIDANINAGNKPATVQGKKVAVEQRKILRQEPQEISISDTEDEGETAMEIEREEQRLNMKRLAKEKRTDVLDQLQTIRDTPAVLLEEDSQVTRFQQQPQENSIFDTAEGEEAIVMTRPRINPKGFDIIVQLETVRNISAVVSGANQGVIVSQPLADDYMADGKREKEISRVDKASSKWNKKLERLKRANQAVPCNLCKDKTATIKQGKKGFHVWTHHMDNNNRFSCKSCGYKTSLTRSIAEHSLTQHKDVESPETNSIDHTAELQAQYQCRYMTAFGAIRKGNRSQPLTKIQIATVSDCKICKRAIRGRYQEEHIWRSHMKAKRYACVHCDYSSGQLKYMNKHAAKHKNMTDKQCWKDNKQSMAEEYKTLQVAAFGIRRSYR